jgi:cell division protein FtsL
MPPAPTDLLAEDVRELRESQQRLTARMDSQEVASRDMREELARFRSRINTILAIVGAAAAILLGSAGMVWTGVASLQRELGGLEATVTNQTTMIDKLDKRFDELRSLGDKLTRVAEDPARLQGRLDRDGSSPAPKGHWDHSLRRVELVYLAAAEGGIA